MSDIVIRAEGLGKKYIIGHQAQRERYTALRDVLAQQARTLWSKTRDLVQGKPIIAGDTLEEVWALRDVSFEIRRGEAVGIIGRNGAGKSTLLKILSRITEPSAGRVTLHGRVASLLEVGTGFHPELTGRENIYLNGAILGMTRAEIRRKFDEIVAFAEVEKYLDTPVKRYSSGMYVRLAFAVAAHLEPEILVVDEVLAVGDAAFQKKCLGKMSDVAGEGRTVLFVSHNMAAIQALCPRSILLKQGQFLASGDSKQVIAEYLATISQASFTSDNLADRTDREGTGEARITRLQMLDADGSPVTTIDMGDALTFRVAYSVTSSVNAPVFGIMIADPYGHTLVRAYSYESHPSTSLPTLQHDGFFQCHFPSIQLMHGRYSVHIWLSSFRYKVDYLQFAGTLEVRRADVYATGRPPDSNNGGFFYLPHSWRFDILSE